MQFELTLLYFEYIFKFNSSTSVTPALYLNSISIYQFPVNLMTGPGICCSVNLLGFGKLFCFPIGYLLAF